MRSKASPARRAATRHEFGSRVDAASASSIATPYPLSTSAAISLSDRLVPVSCWAARLRQSPLRFAAIVPASDTAVVAGIASSEPKMRTISSRSKTSDRPWHALKADAIDGSVRGSTPVAAIVSITVCNRSRLRR